MIFLINTGSHLVSNENSIKKLREREWVYWCPALITIIYADSIRMQHSILTLKQVKYTLYTASHTNSDYNSFHAFRFFFSLQFSEQRSKETRQTFADHVCNAIALVFKSTEQTKNVLSCIKIKHLKQHKRLTWRV